MKKSEIAFSYSFSLSKLSLNWKIFLSYFLTDQAFAVSQEFFKKNQNDKLKHYHLLGSGITLWIVWQVSTIIGIILGSIVPDELGLTFTIPLTFLALLIKYLRKIDQELFFNIQNYHLQPIEL